ncbi:MAG: CoA transferase [Acidimicrobiia bacterium]|jgi:crotonobetainyl-CoA:carnitine CoA-transferase CaiB-like acyl-CoA transferase
MIPAVPGALDGLRVLDLSWGIAGSLGVLMLAEQGADVIKVEPPGGDPFRDYSGYAVWNRSRRSVTLDLKHPEGQAAFHKLAAGADVLVETFRPGVTDRLGIGFDALHAENPRLVYCSCPAYPEGHRLAAEPGYDALVQAASGQQWEQPGWRLGPIFLHMPMPSMAAMFLVPTGILAALIAREDTGRGQHVRTSLLQGAYLYTTQIWTWAEKAPGDFWTIMSKSYPAGSHQEMLFEVANDDWVHMSIMSGLPAIRSQDDILGVDVEASNNERYAMLSEEERAQITPLRKAAYLQQQRDELIAAFRENNHAMEAIVPMGDSLGGGPSGEPHPQLAANGMVATVDDPELGSTTQVGVPIHLAGTPGGIQGPRPTPGQHNDEILGELGYAAVDLKAFT